MRPGSVEIERLNKIVFEERRVHFQKPSSTLYAPEELVENCPPPHPGIAPI